MNRIITANINGFVFQIDEAAYENLKNYLNTIRQKVNDNEVLADIENRIAELFDYKLKNGRQAIFQDDVQDIITQIGNPDQFGSEETLDNGVEANHNAGTGRKKGYRRLYRNEDDKVIGGVCSGIAAYFDIDPLIPRIAFAVSFVAFGFGLLLYLFLMVVLPKAITPAEKLEMRGEPVDYKNLSKTLEKDFKDAYERFKPEVKTGFERFAEVAVKVGMIILIIFLVSIFIPSSFGILASIGLASWSLPVLSSYMFTSYSESVIILIGLILFLLIPVIGIGYKLIRLVFKTKPMGRVISVSLAVLWVTGFCLLAYSTFNIGQQFSSSYKVTTTDTLSGMDKKHTLIIRARQGHDHSEFIIDDGDGEERINIHSRQDMKEFLDEKISENIDLKIIKGLSDRPIIKVSKRSAGRTRHLASVNAEGMEYNYTVKDSIIYLDDYFSLGSGKLWRNQNVVVTLEVPEGYRMYLDPSCNRMFEGSDFSRHRHYRHRDEVTGKYLKIDENGITVPVE
jgi:phage shock protein PspC (stress-responsive transcriptional regulator)